MGDARARRATLLLVDDESDSLEPMRLLLEGEHRVLTALDGERALGLMEHEAVELIIADQRMPGMTGVELLTRVREQWPDVVRLILTAYTDFDAMLKAINEGRVYRYIIKPWDVDDMRLTIRQALEWRELLLARGQLAAELAEAHRALAKRSRELQAAQHTIVRQEKLAAVGQFAAEMVHEMNNTLTFILNINHTLSSVKREELEQIEQIGLQARMLAELAADIRDFAQGAALPFSPARCDPLGVVGEVIRICSRHPDFKGREVIRRGEAGGAFVLDQRQLKHLLLNLLKNAALAGPRGGGIEIELERRSDGLELRVIDHGPGVPEGQRERIFEPFFTTRQGDGSGLGLSICRQVAEAHGGTIVCRETPGGGATFVVWFPERPAVATSS